MLGRKLELGPLAAADAELVDAAVAHDLVAAAQHTGVAQLRTEIVVPQVGVGVEVDDVEAGVFLRYGPHSAQRHQMLAAQQEGQFAVLQDLCRPGLDVGEGCLAGAEAKLEVATVEDVEVGEVGVLVGAVGLEAEALVPDGRRAEPCAGAVAGGGVERCAVKHDVGGAVAAVAADKGFNIG